MFCCLLKQHISAHVGHLQAKVNVKQMQYALLSVATVVSFYIFVTLLSYVLKFLWKIWLK
jgi:hypothetical protein